MQAYEWLFVVIVYFILATSIYNDTRSIEKMR